MSLANVEKVWPYLTVPEKWLEFIPSLVERTRLDTGPVEPGAEWNAQRQG